MVRICQQPTLKPLCQMQIGWVLFNFHSISQLCTVFKIKLRTILKLLRCGFVSSFTYICNSSLAHTPKRTFGTTPRIETSYSAITCRNSMYLHLKYIRCYSSFHLLALYTSLIGKLGPLQNKILLPTEGDCQQCAINLTCLLYTLLI